MSGRRVRYVAGRPDLRQRNVVHLVRMAFGERCPVSGRSPGCRLAAGPPPPADSLSYRRPAILILQSNRTGMMVECLASDLRALEHDGRIAVYRNPIPPIGAIMSIGSANGRSADIGNRDRLVFAERVLPGARLPVDPCLCCGDRCPSQLDHLKPGEPPWRFCAGCDPALDEHEPGSWRCPCREAVAS